jgi:hypothetical protein
MQQTFKTLIHLILKIKNFFFEKNKLNSIYLFTNFTIEPSLLCNKSKAIKILKIKNC